MKCVPICVLTAFALVGLEGSSPARQRGLVQRSERAEEGYVLFAPLRSTSTYLIDTEGEVVHEWKSNATPGNSVYLLENGHLLRAERLPSHPVFRGGGQGGRISEYDWDGKLVWRYTCSGPDYMQHHDLERLPNGNVLAIAWERKSAEEAVSLGRDPELLRQELWPDKVLELRPVPPDDAEVVWEWHVWDHLVQEFDETKPGFGDVAAHPELVDINAGAHVVQEQRRQAEEERLAELEKELAELRALGYVGEDDDPDAERRRRRAGVGSDWMHTNSIAYNSELDQILLSVRSFNEIWVIDHSTTNAEAAGHEGGRWGRGGDLLYRWGNPRMYGHEGEPALMGQHDAHWIAPNLEGAGHMLVFNNMAARDGRRVSSAALEIEPPFDERKGYELADSGTFGPSQPSWAFAPAPGSGFFSARLSGAQRLPGGNTLLCAGDNGVFTQVTPAGQVVWEYRNPFLDEVRAGASLPRNGGGVDASFERGGGPPTEGQTQRQRPTRGAAVFRALYYPPDYSGLAALEER